MSRRVTVGAYNNPIEAHLARGRLEVEGIPASLAHEHHVWANWMYSQALGGVKVQVPPAHVEAARKILDTHDTGGYEASLGEVVAGVDENRCPACGSRNFRSRFPVGKLLLLLLTLGLASVIFPPRRELHTCGDCGWQWRY
jgi:hypothetical protein